MKYPKQTENYDVDVFNENFRELDLKNATVERNLQNEIERAKAVETAQEAALDSVAQNADKALSAHTQRNDNPHKVTKNQVGLGNVNNTADIDKPVSTAQQAALDEQYQQLTAYTQQKIADLINGAPTSMDTLKEVSDAIAAHKSVMDALDAAIGEKASAAEFDSHVKDTTKHILAAERKKWNNGSASYGSCSTAAATAAKTVVCTGFELATGAEITVKFTVTNTATNPTLNVNSTGAKAIYYRGAAIVAGFLAANRTYIFRYNGAQWELVGDLNTNTTYSNFVKSGSGAKAGLVPAPSTTAGTTKYLREDGTWQTPPNTNTTYSDATQSKSGLMTSADKKKLDSIPEDTQSKLDELNAGLTELTLRKYTETVKYSTTANAGGYIKIRFKTGDIRWMLSCVVSVYQNYASYRFNVQGYFFNLNGQIWYDPKIISIESSATNIPDVAFGYETINGVLVPFVAFAQLHYCGVSVSDFTNGYYRVDQWDDKVEIVHEDAITGTIQVWCTNTPVPICSNNICKIQVITKAQYDAMGSGRDSSILYIVKG